MTAYGTNYTDPISAPRGPSFIIQPHNLVVVEEDSRASTDGERFSVSVECLADGNPLPSYRITKTRINGVTEDISAAIDERYTITGGR